MRRRGRGAQQDVVRTVGAKDHLQQLREVFLVGNVVVVLEDVEQVVGLQAVTELLDRLGTDAIDAQQILLGLADQVADRLDADLTELVGPALRHAQVVEQVQASLLGGDGVAVAGERTVSTTELVVAGPVELLRKLLVQVLELHRSPLGQRLGVGRSRAVDVHVAVGRAIRQLGVGVRLEAGTGRDLLTDDDVGLKVEQVVDLALNGSLGKDAGGTDERSARQPGVDVGRDLERTQDDGLGHGSLTAQTGNALDLVGELVAVDVLTKQVLGVTGVGDLNATQHLTCEHLDVLVVQVNALAGVDVLDALDEGVHRRLDVGQLAQVAEVDEALGDLVAGANLAAVLDLGHKAHRCGNATLVEDTCVVLGVGERQHVLGLLGLNREVTGVRSQLGLATQNLLVDVADDIEHTADRRQTLRNIVDASDAAGVNGTHRKLRTGLADGLGGNNADRGTDGDRTTSGKIPAVALLAHAVLGAAGEQRAKLDLLKARIDHLLDVGDLLDVAILLKEHGAIGSHDVLDEATADEVGVEVGGAGDDEVVGDALVRAAVLLADDDVLGHVDQTTGQVTRVRGVGCGIDQALTGAVGRNEVLERQQALAEVRLNGKVDRLAGHVCHQTTHAAELTQLGLRTTGAGVGHHVQRVLLVEHVEHERCDLVGTSGPLVNDFDVALRLVDEALLEVLVDLVDVGLGAIEQLLLLGRDESVPHRDGEAGAGSVVEAGVLDGVEDRADLGLGVTIAAVGNQLGHVALDHLVVHELIVFGQALAVEDDAADGGLEARGLVAGDVVVDKLVLAVLNAEDTGAVLVDDIGVGSGHADLNLGLHVDLGAAVIGVQRVVEAGEHVVLARQTLANLGEVVHTDDHVLRRDVDRLAGCRRAQVVRREHKHASLGLSLAGQRHVDRHLVAVEVGVEGRADQRMQVDSLALDQHRLKGLDGQTVQGRCTVEQHDAAVDDLFEDVPHKGGTTVDSALGALDVLDLAKLDQALHDEGLEELQRHGLGQTALVQQQLGVGNNYRTAGVVDTLAQQVLTETTLLALEGLGERLERATTTARDRATTTAVVEQGVHGLLEHALLVVHDDRRGVQVEQALESVVTVDHATIQVVEVGRGEAAAVELDHRAQIGRNDRDDIQDHVRGAVAALQEGVNDLEALDGLLALLLLGVLVGDDGLELLGLGGEVDGSEQVADGLGTHATLEVHGVVTGHLAEQRLIGNEVALAELHEGVEGVRAELLLVLALFLDVDDARGDLLGGQRLLVGELVKVLGVALLLEGLDLAGALGIDLFQIGGELLAQVVGVGLASLVVDLGDDVAGKVQNLLEVLGLDVEHTAHREARGALEVPDVGHGSGELDVAHAVATHLGRGDLDAAALADDALKADALVLAAGALPVLGGTEDLLAEQAVLLGLEGTVIDGLRLLDLTVRPGTDLVGGGKGDLYRVKISSFEICHSQLLLISGRGGDSLGCLGGLGILGLDVGVNAGERCQVVESGGLLGGHRGGGVLVGIVHGLDVQCEGADLLDENLEGLGDTRDGNVLALDDGLVGLDAAHGIVGLDGQDLLQDVGSTVCVQCPNFHLAEALAAELGLAAQRLLGNQAVGASRTGVDLVVDHVAELEDVGRTHGNGLAELLAGAAVEQTGLAALVKLGDELGAHVIAKGSGGLVEHVLVSTTDDLGDLVLLGAVEDGRRGEERTGDVLVGVGLLGIPTAGSGPAKVALEQLADVHTRGNAQRVEDNVDRSTVSHVGHVLDRQNVTDNTLVAVAAGDLIALLDLTTLGDVDAHLLVDAGGQVVAVLAAKADDVDDAAVSTVRHLKGGVADIVGLGTEDGAQQALLGG